MNNTFLKENINKILLNIREINNKISNIQKDIYELKNKINYNSFEKDDNKKLQLCIKSNFENYKNPTKYQLLNDFTKQSKVYIDKDNLFITFKSINNITIRINS